MRRRKRLRDVAHQRWKISRAQFPADAGKGSAAGLDEFRDDTLIAAEIAEFLRVLQGKTQWLDGPVETDHAQRATQIRRGAKNRQNIGGRAKTDVPDDKFTRMGLQSLAQLELVDIEGLRLGRRADHRMKRFILRHGTDAEGAIGQPDKFVIRDQWILATWPPKAFVKKVPLDGQGGNGNNAGMDALLKLLQENAALKPEQLAKMLNLSEAEIAAKIKAYENDQVILGYRAVLNEEKIGADVVRAVIEVKITPERGGGFDRLAERIAKYTEVRSCYLMSGGYDLQVVVEGANLREVATFVSEKLATIQGVVSTATHFMLKVYKEQGMLIREEKNEDRLAVSP